MWNVNATRLLAPAAAALALAGCADTPKAEAPAGVMLAGNWKLDHAASDDPQKVLDKMREQARKIIQRQTDAMARAAGAGGSGGPGGSGGGVPPLPDQSPTLGGDEPGPGGPHGGRRRDPLQNSPMAHALSKVIARGDYLTLRQSSDELQLDYGTTQRSYTPGARSVVSAEMGVADQTSGWDGRQYLIKIKAQLGPNIIESYALSPDGSHLINKVHIGPAELPAIDLTRIYDRTNETAPRAPPAPTSD